jgi:hypothetical protein
LLIVASLMTAGAGAVEGMVGPVRRLERPVRFGAAGVLILAGVHDALVYWAL